MKHLYSRLKGALGTPSRLAVPDPGPAIDIAPWKDKVAGLRIRPDERREATAAVRVMSSTSQLFPNAASLLSESDAIKSDLGVRPISFSFPTALVADSVPAKVQVLSEIVPGKPYTFDNIETYYGEYRRSVFAMTHRKAGWDCFRHVEILGSGCIPLMPDAHAIPTRTMIHYPKAALAHMIAEPLSHDAKSFGSALREFLDYTKSSLSTVAMTQHVCTASRVTGANKVLFVDEASATRPDYLSVLALIGLKEIFGEACHSWYPTDYIYKDFIGDSFQMYGRGFGYTKILPPEYRSTMQVGVSGRDLKRALRSDRFDFVVVGSAPRNPSLTRFVLRNFQASQVVLLDGEDQPPSPALLDRYSELNSNVFIRELP